MGTVINLDWARNARHMAPAGSPPTAACILSFMAPPDTEADPDNSRPSYWAVKSSGDRSKDIESGRAYADEYLAFVGMCPTELNQLLLVSIIHEMVERAGAGEKWTSIQFAFLARVSKLVMAAAAFQQGVSDYEPADA